jgi:Tol biopolymer transport system component
MLIAGAVGCLVMCICVAGLGAGTYFIVGPAATMPTPFAIAIPTLLTAPTAAPSSAPTLPALPPTPAQSPTFIGAVPTIPPALTIPVPRVTATTAPRAPTGKIAFSKSEGDRPEDKYLWIMNADGTGARMVFERASDPALAADGTKIAYYHWTDGMWLANVDGSNARKYIGDSKARSPAWSHDGRWIAFTGIDAVPSSVLAGETPLRRGVVVGTMPDWSPDDTQIVFQTCRENICGIYKANAQTGAAMLVVGDDGSLPVWSPDGRTILYQREIAGERQLFTIHPDGAGKKQLTTGPAPHVAANWSRDGNFIFYRSPEGGAWAIWRMNADGSNRVKLIDNVPPVDWAFEKLAVSR